jgi:hypothetical protein
VRALHSSTPPPSSVEKIPHRDLSAGDDYITDALCPQSPQVDGEDSL